jgi:hypothetical protein
MASGAEPRPVLPATLRGGCQCGACRYETTSGPLFGYVCHCRECRRQSGGAFSASVIVLEDGLSVTGPIATWWREGPENPPLEATFCRACGVRLLHRAVPREAIARIKAGTLDDATWFRPAAEFFTTRRLDWVDLGAGTIECPERAEDQAALLAAWQRIFAPA